MSTKPVNTRATIATRAGRVRHGVGHKAPFSRRGSRNASEDPRPNILQLNIEGLTADKISVIEQLAYKNKAFIIVLQETHCTTADSWATSNKLGLLLTQRKQPERQHKPRPDLREFASFRQDSRMPDRRVLGKFPGSQHRPSLITPPKLKALAHSDPMKRWSFRKADWKCFRKADWKCFRKGDWQRTDESVERMAPPDTSDIEGAYQDFCESLLSAAKQCTPLIWSPTDLESPRKNYMPCWDKECETLYPSFIRAPVRTDSDRAASSLLSQLGQKKQERWEEAVNSIDFSHSSRKAWRTIKKLTGKSGRSFHQCPVSANSIATQLVKNGTHRTVDREFTRLVNKELSGLWKIPTPQGCSTSEPFRPEELAAALRRLKPGRSPGLDSFKELPSHISAVPVCPL